MVHDSWGLRPKLKTTALTHPETAFFEKQKYTKIIT